MAPSMGQREGGRAIRTRRTGRDAPIRRPSYLPRIEGEDDSESHGQSLAARRRDHSFGKYVRRIRHFARGEP